MTALSRPRLFRSGCYLRYFCAVTTGQYDYEATTAVAFERAITWDKASRVASETDWSYQGSGTLHTDIVNSYGTGTGYALGAVVTSTATTKNASNVQQSSAVTTNAYAWYDGAAVSGTTIATDYASGGPADTTFSTTYAYGPAGTLRTATITDGRPRTVTFRSDVLGQVIRRDEADGNAANGDPHTAWYRYDGRELGAVGNDGDADEDYAASIATRMRNAGTGAFQGGQATGVAYARFGQAADAVTTFAQGGAAGSVTAGAGDTLQSIALRIWGDANLWYKLAETRARP